MRKTATGILVLILGLSLSACAGLRTIELDDDWAVIDDAALAAVPELPAPTVPGQVNPAGSVAAAAPVQ